MKPVKKSERLAQQFREGDIKFVKAFWNLTELPVATRFGAVVGAAVEVSICNCLSVEVSIWFVELPPSPLAPFFGLCLHECIYICVRVYIHVCIHSRKHKLHCYQSLEIRVSDSSV